MKTQCFCVDIGESCDLCCKRTMKLPFFPTCRLNYDDRVYVRWFYREMRKTMNRGQAKTHIVILMKVGRNV